MTLESTDRRMDTDIIYISMYLRVHVDTSRYRYGDMRNINFVSHNLPSRNIVSHMLTSLLDSLPPNAPIGATWEYISVSHHRIAWSSNLPILLATKLPHRLGKSPSFFKGDDR